MKISFIQKIDTISLTKRQLFVIELLVIIGVSLFPLFFEYPYRINIYLSWEGAYRLFLGQVPFKDFYLPMGFGYWILPAVFFKIFGPYMFSLIKSQVLINVATLLAFRTTLKTLDVAPARVLLAVVVFCLSYIFLNFWPWYNQTVIAYEIIGLCFVVKSIFSPFNKKTIFYLGLGSLFVFLSFFTKQDSGGFAILISFSLLGYHSILSKTYSKFGVFILTLAFWTGVFIIPFLQYDFLYWFNYGQPPHTSRLEIADLAGQFLGWSYWEKFYLLLMTLLIVEKSKSFRQLLQQQNLVVFAIIVYGIILQAVVVQVTSPVPPGNEVFYHGFAFAFIISNLNVSLDFNRVRYIAISIFLITLWWSGVYWRNIKKLFTSVPLVVERTTDVNRTPYRVAREYPTLDGLFLAEPTIEGIERIRDLDIVKNQTDLKVLNMSELTSLAHEIGYTPMTDQTMWYHQDVSIFDQQIDEFCQRISRYEFDLVLFETIPENEVKNFYPEAIRACLQQNYQQVDRFLAPRTPEMSFIEVYVVGNR